VTRRGEHRLRAALNSESQLDQRAALLVAVLDDGHGLRIRHLVQAVRSRLALSAEHHRCHRQVLLDAGVPIFQRSEWLVRPVIDTVDASHGRQTKVARFIRFEATYLRDLLGRVADFRKYDKRSNKWVPIDPPPQVAQTVLARQGEWKFPVVAGVITTPTMRPDGSLLTQPGYDPPTRLLLVEPPPMPLIPDAPTRDDALKALSLLRGLLGNFRWLVTWTVPSHCLPLSHPLCAALS
jgi:hypothetical protein